MIKVLFQQNNFLVFHPILPRTFEFSGKSGGIGRGNPA